MYVQASTYTWMKNLKIKDMQNAGNDIEKQNRECTDQRDVETKHELDIDK